MRLVCAVLLWCCVGVAAQAAVWREATSEKFVVYSDGNEKALVEFTEKVEKFDQVLRLMTGLKRPASPLKLRIYLVANGTQVRALMPHPERYTAGFYSVTMEGAVAVVSRERAGDQFDLSGQAVLFHEYAHHFMAQYFPTAYPVWYREGFAEYFSSTQINDDGSVAVGRIAMHRVPGLVYGRWLTPTQLMDGSFEQLDSEQRGQFYAQGWLLTHYMHRDAKGRQQLSQYLELRASGTPHAEALQQAFGMNDEQLGKVLQQYYVKGKFQYSKIDKSNLTVPQVTVRQLPATESAMLLLGVRAQLGVEKAAQADFVAQVRREAARYPTDDAAQLVLAETEANFGDREAARKSYESLAAKEPPNRRALIGLGFLLLADRQEDLVAQRAAYRKVRRLAAKANRLMTEDPAALLLFYMSFSADENGANDNARQGLAAAYESLPQNWPAAVMLAGEYLHDAHPEQAIELLKPIAYEPHGGGRSQQAQQWIEAIRAKQSVQLPNVFYGNVGSGE